MKDSQSNMHEMQMQPSKHINRNDEEKRYRFQCT